MNKTFKARASRAGLLMSNSRSGSGLSETAKNYIIEAWIENTYGRFTDISNKFIEKGLAVEEDAITLYSEVTGDFYRKNINRYENDFVTGTPDIITPEGVVIDIKSSWNLLTYVKAGLSTLYEYQLRSYMDMVGLDSAILAYCLVDTPEHLILAEAKRIAWQVKEDEMTIEEIVEGLRKQMTFGDIPKENRVKTFQIKRDPDKIQELYSRITKAREFYDTLSLNILTEA